jgi:hypothetical protein
MSGKPRIIRSIQSYINHADTHAGLGPLKAGNAPSIGVTHTYWFNYQSQCQPNKLERLNPGTIANNYDDLVWLNIRPTYTPSPKKSYNSYGLARYASKQVSGKMFRRI